MRLRTQKDFDVAQALYREAQVTFDAAQTRLTQRKLFTPVESLVQLVHYRPGETVPVVPVGCAIMSLLPPGDVKVGGYVAEPLLARIAII